MMLKSNQSQQFENESVYDAHSHVGADMFNVRNSDLFDYFETARKLKVKTANIMSVPCPVYETELGRVYALIWEKENNNIRYFKKIESKSGVIIEENPINPYSQANERLREFIAYGKNKGIDLRYVPLIHPLFDKESQIEKIISEKPVAVKIHGIASGIIPEQVPKRLLKRIGQSGIPVIVHTDNFNGDINNYFTYLRNKNTALNWLGEFDKFGVRGYIAHGAYLCKESFDKINFSNQHLLGIGPVVLIQKEGEHFLQSESEGYLNLIFNSVDIDKIAFDIDFPWNVKDRSFKEEDLDSKRLVCSLLNNLEREKVLRTNAERFFKIKNLS